MTFAGIIRTCLLYTSGLGIWGVINLLEGYGNDNPGAKSQGMKQLMACLLYTSGYRDGRFSVPSVFFCWKKAWIRRYKRNFVSRICSLCQGRDVYKRQSRSRAVENPTSFTQNPMKRFQTPTSRNPVLVRRRTKNRTFEVRKSILRSTKTRQYIEIQRLKRFIYILSIPILSELISAGFSLWKTRIGKEWGKEQNGTTRNFTV